MAAKAYDAGYKDGLAWDLSDFSSLQEIEQSKQWDDATINAIGSTEFAVHCGIEAAEGDYPAFRDAFSLACVDYDKGARDGAVAQWRSKYPARAGDDLVLLETMPDQHRASHRAARNWGTYPHNGAERAVVSLARARETVEADPDRYDHIVRGATDSDVERYGTEARGDATSETATLATSVYEKNGAWACDDGHGNEIAAGLPTREAAERRAEQWVREARG